MKSNLLVEECSQAEYAAALQALPHKEPISFLQAPFYGAWQEHDGKTVVYFRALDGRKIVAAGLAAKLDAPGGISFFYCPYGPVVQKWTPELLQAVREFFKPIAKRTGAAFVRLDSLGLTDLPGVKPVANHVAVTASLQPRNEWELDISPKDQEIVWMGMHKHARYNVRLAERASAKLEFFEPAKAPLDTFYKLMQATGGRDRFSIHRREYFKAVLEATPPKDGFVALCTIDGKPAATAFYAAYDGVMHYVFAGSSDDFRKIAPPYYVMWNAILEARRRGWHKLNFGGIVDTVKSLHVAGVTAFKKRFGGYEIHHPNPVDLVYNRPKYTLFSLYKRVKR